MCCSNIRHRPTGNIAAAMRKDLESAHITAGLNFRLRKGVISRARNKFASRDIRPLRLVHTNPAREFPIPIWGNIESQWTISHPCKSDRKSCTSRPLVSQTSNCSETVYPTPQDKRGIRPRTIVWKNAKESFIPRTGCDHAPRGCHSGELRIIHPFDRP